MMIWVTLKRQSNSIKIETIMGMNNFRANDNAIGVDQCSINSFGSYTTMVKAKQFSNLAIPIDTGKRKKINNEVQYG